MCIICTNEYNEQTFKINCLGCTKIQTLPDPTKLPRITELYISYTKIQEIPFKKCGSCLQNTSQISQDFALGSLL